MPPSSRRTRFTVPAEAAITALPVVVEPVNATASTRGSVVSSEATSAEDDETTLSTPGGISVCSATSRPRCVADQGESGEGLRTTEQPLRARTDLRERELDGMFHGVMAPTTDGLAHEEGPSAPSPPSSRVVYRSAGEVGVEAELLDRPVELVAVGHPTAQPISPTRSRRSVSASSRIGLLQLAQARARSGSVAHEVA